MYELDQSDDNSVLFDDVVVRYAPGFAEIGEEGLANAIAREMTRAAVKENAEGIESVAENATALRASINTVQLVRSPGEPLNDKTRGLANAGATDSLRVEVSNTNGRLESMGERVTGIEAEIDDPDTGLSSKASVDELQSAQSSNDDARAELSATLRADYDGKLASKSSVQYVDEAMADESSARSSAISGVQSQLDDDLAAVQESLETDIDSVSGDVSALYTLRVQTNANGTPVAGGLIIGANGETVDAVWNVDTFAFTDPSGGSVYPFVYSGGRTVIREAMIEQLTFSKLVDDDGKVLIEDGRIQGDYLAVDQARSTGTMPDGRPLWELRQNGGAYMRDAYVRGDVEATSIKTGTANIVDTLMLQGNAVTVPLGAFISGDKAHYGFSNAISLTIPANTFPPGTTVSIWFGFLFSAAHTVRSSGYSSASTQTGSRFRLYIDGDNYLERTLATDSATAYPANGQNTEAVARVGGAFAYSIQETLGADKHTITLQAATNGSGDTITQARFIQVIGLKR